MNALNIDALPAPAVIESLDYVTVLAALRADLVARYPAAAAVMALESEPINKLLEVAAYRELLLRARVNDAARALLLPYATGRNLDNLAARYDLARLPGEDDARFRARVLLGYHALSAAGSPASWRLCALSHSTDVRQVDVWSDRPGRVKMALLARVAEATTGMDPAAREIGRTLFGDYPNTGTLEHQSWRVAQVGDLIISQVEAAMLAEDVRPLTIDVDVTSARILPLQVQATLVHTPAQDGHLLATQAAARVRQLASQAAFRVDLTCAAIVAALMVDGARDAQLATPAQDTPAGKGEVPVITAVAVTPVARND